MSWTKSKITIRELANLIASEMGVDVITPKVSKTLEGSPENVFLDMSKSESEFNRKNYISISEGLKRTIEWQRNLYKK